MKLQPCVLVVLVACRGDAPPRKQPVETKPPTAVTVDATTIDAAELAVSDLSCNTIFPQADRDKLVPKAYLVEDKSSHRATSSDCTFEVVIDPKRARLAKFDIDVGCGYGFTDDTTIAETVKTRGEAAGEPADIPGVGKRAIRGITGDSYRWALGWDDDSPCRVEVEGLPDPFDNRAVLSTVLRHITAK